MTPVSLCKISSQQPAVSRFIPSIYYTQPSYIIHLTSVAVLSLLWNPRQGSFINELPNILSHKVQTGDLEIRQSEIFQTLLSLNYFYASSVRPRRTPGWFGMTQDDFSITNVLYSFLLNFPCMRGAPGCRVPPEWARQPWCCDSSDLSDLTW